MEILNILNVPNAGRQLGKVIIVYLLISFSVKYPIGSFCNPTQAETLFTVNRGVRHEPHSLRIYN